MNSTSSAFPVPSGFHVAIIMDGNGRWATQRGMRRAEGHCQGAQSIRKVVEAAPSFGVTALTLYAFSGKNWARPKEEVAGLMRLFADFLRDERDNWGRCGVRLSVIGRRDRIPSALLNSIEAAESTTCTGEQLHLRLAIDYSGQEMIVEAARRFASHPCRGAKDFARLMALASHARTDDPEVDLVIRTGGEQRLSDFLLWEMAYAELWFTDKLWPDFSAGDLAAAVRDFRSRERRYGQLTMGESEESMPSILSR
ncbi:MAG: polyprenyl diphosphate synthase [Terriglobia bacterium]